MDRVERAYRLAVRLVGRRPRTEHELRASFGRLGLSEPEQEGLLQNLRRAGLVGDAEFAAAWLENRMVFRPRSAGALRAELRARGVPGEVVEQALHRFDEERAAELAARQGMRKYQHLSPESFRQRLSAYLTRRGFQHSTVGPLIDRLAGERDAEGKDSR
jgi:regulatory protein